MDTRMSLYHQKPKPTKKYGQFFKKYAWLIAILIVVLSSIFGYVAYQSYENNMINKYQVKGIMISQSNGYIDFVTLSNTGQKFVYIRASQGATYTDDDFSDNFQRSQGSGLQVGSYHVFSTQTAIKDQLKNFTREVGDDYGTLPPLVEVTSPLSDDQVHRLSDFIYMVHKYYDTNVVVRSSTSVFDRLDKKVAHDVQFFSGNVNNKRANFIEVKNNRKINIDGSNVYVNQIAFNGNKKGWQQYLLKNQDR
ncbi:GH25 family lysozyme [Apilactobacillus kunkeei]|uniref:GH25 family lysozyme n=1 Tax=Apilactobacillus kunkeei TaxID=148814 RepID=UPI004033CA4D